MRTRSWVIFISFVLFMGLLGAGFLYSQVKPLWNDELYTQTKSIEKISYGQILAGQVPEGNNSPLFYLLQKGLCDLTGYRLPFLWKGEWYVSEPAGQVILRVLPNVCMALSLMAVFYFLSVKYSYWAGAYGLLTGLLTPAVWLFWAEARPYALWFALTTAQIFLFWDAIEKGRAAGKVLTLCNLLLCLTIFFGVVQVAVVSALIFFFIEKRSAKSLLPAGLPILAGLFYFSRAAKYQFNLPADRISLITDNVVAENFVLLSVFCGFVLLQNLKRGKDEQTPSGRTGLWSFVAAMFLSAVLMLGVFYLMSDPGEQRFEIANRYFIFLAPVGIIAMPVMAAELLGVFRQNLWMTVNIYIVLGGLFLSRLLQIAPQVSNIFKF